MQLAAHQPYGFSVLEQLVSLAISIPLLVAGTALFGNFTKIDILSKERTSRIESLLTIESYISKVASDSDSYRLPIFPRVHKGSAITLTNGSPHAIMDRSDSLAPSPFSDAITGIRILSAKPLATKSGSIKGKLIDLAACGSSRAISKNIPPTRSYLGISVDGMGEFVDLDFKTRRFDHSGCIHLNLIRDESMIVPVEPREFIPGLLYPIDSLYTLYVSANGELRFLSHAGKSTVENQPITEGIETLSIERSTLPSHETDVLRATLKLVGESEVSFSAYQKLRRLSPIAVLLRGVE